MRRRSGPRIAILVAIILTLATAGVGLVATLILESPALVFDDLDAYGEVPIPATGCSVCTCPRARRPSAFTSAGHAQPVVRGFRLSDLQFPITPPAGARNPKRPSVGGTTTVNSDTHVRV